MKTKYAIGIVFFALLMVLGTVIFSASAESPNYDPSLSHSTDIEVQLCTTYYDSCIWDPQAETAWSDDTWILDWPGGTLQIHVSDGFWYGDWFELVIVDADGNIVQDLGTTPEVETGPQHSCSNPMHTGQGNVYSERLFSVYLPAGTYRFKVYDNLFPILADEGVDLAGTGWSPAGFYIHFLRGQEGVPEFGLGVPMVTAVAMLMMLAGKYRKKA
ncbi:MAG: hypothetical protein QXO75_06100 [Nitrososphaerota archaeon]